MQLCGDETAFPALTRIARGLPATARATNRIEVADATEGQPILSKAALDLEWPRRNGSAAETTDLIENAPFRSPRIRGSAQNRTFLPGRSSL